MTIPGQPPGSGSSGLWQHVAGAPWRWRTGVAGGAPQVPYPPYPPQLVWFMSEHGILMCQHTATMDPAMIIRFARGQLRQVREDGTPWEGRQFWEPAPPPPLPEETTIDTLRGYRHWEVTRDGYLQSHGDFPWATAGHWTRARCDTCSTVPSDRPCRDYGYGCGLYAAAAPDPVIQADAWGVIEAKGDIVWHDRGFRAQYARPVALAAPRPVRMTRAGPAGPDLMMPDHDAVPRLTRAYQQLAGRYGVPLLPAAALIAEYAPDGRAA